MKISASPCSRCSSRSRFRYCAWMVRSRLVVGSSAISSRGSQEMPMAPTMRWRMPPDISCGILRARGSPARRCAPSLSSPTRALPGAGAAGALVHAERLADLVADGEQRVQRGHRVLQDHGDALAAHAGASRRRTCRSRSSPSNSIRPLVMCAAGGSRRRMVRASVLLPEPDSPTMPERLAGVEARATPRRPRAPRACPARRRSGWTGSPATAAVRRHGGLHSWRSCGSSFTRSQSPRRLADSTISMMQMPGSTVSHQ